LEIAMVVTPHLAGRVDLLAYDGSNLTLIARTSGLTNHRIGDPDIAGGIRICENTPQMILAKMPWRKSGDSRMAAVSLSNGSLEVSPFKEPFTPQNVAKAKTCTIHPE